MICVGIITVRKNKASFLRRLLGTASIVDRFSNTVEYIVAELPYTDKEVCKLSYLRKRYSIYLAKKFLKKNGATYIVNEDEKAQSHIDVPISKEYISKCIESMLSKKQYLSGRAVIIDRNMDKVNFEILSKICLFIDEMVIVTDNTRIGEQLAEDIFTEYGMFPEVCRIKNVSVADRIVINADEGYVRTDNEIAQKVRLRADTGKYKIDIVDMISHMPQVQDKIKFTFEEFLSENNN